MQKPKKKERRRSTHLELLGGVPTDALRRIREIAGKADLPIERVFRDVLAIGVSVVTDPEESPYQSLIAFRAGLANKQAEFEHEEQDGPVLGTAEPGLPGGVVLQIDQSKLVTADQEETIEERPDDAFERPRQFTPLEENIGLVEPD